MSNVTFGTGPFFEGQTYKGSNGIDYLYFNGCFTIPRPADIDTVDGYAEQGVSDGTHLDANGNAIPIGSEIVTFYDGAGDVVNSKDCTDVDTVDGHSLQGVADGSQLDSSGNAIPIGAQIITFYGADGAVINSKDCTDDDTLTQDSTGSILPIDSVTGNQVLPGPLVQVDGDEPAPGSSVVLWINEGVAKTLGVDGWVQISPYTP